MLLPSAFSMRSSCDSVFRVLTPARQPCGCLCCRTAAQPAWEETPLAFNSLLRFLSSMWRCLFLVSVWYKFLRSHMHTAELFLFSIYLICERQAHLHLVLTGLHAILNFVSLTRDAMKTRFQEMFLLSWGCGPRVNAGGRRSWAQSATASQVWGGSSVAEPSWLGLARGVSLWA